MLRRAALALLVFAACGAPVVHPDGGGAPADSGAGGGDGGVRRIASLTVTPTSLTLGPGGQAPLTATATFDDGTTGDVSGSASWISTDPSVATVAVVSSSQNQVRVDAVSAGGADVTAQVGALTSNVLHVTVEAGDGGRPDGGARPDGGSDAGPPSDAGTARGEVRAIWVTRFAYNNAADVRGIIANAAAGGFNTVFFQIRGNGDAFYRSSLAPWAKKLTGTLGQDPGWDPLQTAIDEAHLHGVQLHAYFNVFAGWPCTAAGPTVCNCLAAQGQAGSCVLPEASAAGAPTHYLRAHPEAMVVDSTGRNQDTEYFWLSPADPGVRAHLVAAVTELLTNYAVDGLHLDRVRYPGPWASYDPASVSGFAQADAGLGRADWQRENVSSLVGELYQAVKAVRPTARLTASVWGIYAVLPGCSTSQGYAQYFQDSLGWVHTSRIDQIVTMTYWDIGTGCTDWARLTQGFVADAGADRVIAGMHALDNLVVQPARISARISYARSLNAAGTSIFASSYFGPTTWTSLRDDGGVYASDAGLPPITWR